MVGVPVCRDRHRQTVATCLPAGREVPLRSRSSWSRCAAMPDLPAALPAPALEVAKGMECLPVPARQTGAGVAPAFGRTGAPGKTQGRAQRGGGALACSQLLSLKISSGAV
jgi:hypothetical protein